jgi:hypothetical protein
MSHLKDLDIVRTGVRVWTRREAARFLLACAASGGFAWATASHPVWKHFANEGLMEAAEAAANGANLHFLSAAQFESLAFLAEAIVPGSSKAKSAEFIDLLLSVEEEKNQDKFVRSLSQLDAESTKRFGKKLAAIAPADLNGLLVDASSQPKADEKTESLRNAFENLKQWISGAYYSSEIGMRELGWTADRVFSEFPGCTHSDHNS